MADGDWSNIPRLVLSLEFEPLPIEIITITAWPFVTTIIPFEIFTNGVEIVRDAYPYVTEIVIIDTFLHPPLSLSQGSYIGGNANTTTIPLETQPLPELNAIISAASIQIIPLGCLDLPVEFWG